MKVLNVGGGTDRRLPPFYPKDVEQLVLDIDPETKPDICCDALDMKSLNAGEYDSVYCSHNLEHFYSFEVPKVLEGFKHVLKDGGSVYICVPNLKALMESMLRFFLDLEDVM